MTTPAFKNAKGRLTAYGLQCGYIEAWKNARGDSVTLSYRHGCYHIVEVEAYGAIIRRTARTLADARSEYASHVRLLKKVFGD